MPVYSEVNLLERESWFIGVRCSVTEAHPWQMTTQIRCQSITNNPTKTYMLRLDAFRALSVKNGSEKFESRRYIEGECVFTVGSLSVALHVSNFYGL